MNVLYHHPLSSALTLLKAVKRSLITDIANGRTVEVDHGLIRFWKNRIWVPLSDQGQSRIDKDWKSNYSSLSGILDNAQAIYWFLFTFFSAVW